MYGRGERQHIPDVDDREFGRLGPIASREPPASSARDYAGAVDASFDRKGHLLHDVREHAGDFGEWRMDYERDLARYLSMRTRVPVPMCLPACLSLALPVDHAFTLDPHGTVSRACPHLCLWSPARLQAEGRHAPGRTAAAP